MGQLSLAFYCVLVESCTCLWRRLLREPLLSCADLPAARMKMSLDEVTSTTYLCKCRPW